VGEEVEMTLIGKLGRQSLFGAAAVALSLCMGGCGAAGDENAPAAQAEALASAEADEAAAQAEASKHAPSITPAASCDLQIGVTRKNGNDISGYGSQSNCGPNGDSYLTIQRSRWYGWEDLSTQTVHGSGHDVYVHYNCAGTGTHEFRTIHTATTIGGNYKFKESNHITVTCP
jgi:hypothetical protein